MKKQNSSVCKFIKREGASCSKNNLCIHPACLTTKDKIQDNPVPSLENILKEFYRDHYEMFRRGAYDFISEDDFVKEQVALYKLNNPQYFQNGVETNKEQPECGNLSGVCTCPPGYLCGNAG